MVRILVPITRDDTCLGLMEFESEKCEVLSEDEIQAIRSVAAIMSLLFEKQKTIDIFTVLQQPIDFHQGNREFLDDLLALISTASGMPFVVLREYDSDGQSLTCLAHLGFSQSLLHSDLNLLPVSDYKSFQKAIETGCSVAEPNMEDPRLSNLKERKELSSIKSFVVTPVKVGPEVFGTLSFGCASQHNYSALEIAAFETVANCIGVAITNFRNFHKRQEVIHEKIKIGTTITAIEVAQAARHQARHHLALAIERSTLIKRRVQKGVRGDDPEIKQMVEEMNAELVDIGLSLEKIKEVTRSPELIKKDASINDIWKDAFSTVQGRLNLENIDFSISQKTASGNVYPDFLMHAFLNLILNSIDAFKEFGKRRSRSISVTIDPPTTNYPYIKIKYADNAGGIDPSKLQKISDPNAALEVKDIFEQGVTSKKDGSGFGLHLVRSLLAEHDGSINLASYRGGVQFEIVIPQ